jgi:hypothetical protein
VRCIQSPLNLLEEGFAGRRKICNQLLQGIDEQEITHDLVDQGGAAKWYDKNTSNEALKRDVCNGALQGVIRHHCSKKTPQITLTGLYVSLRLTEFCDKECQHDG